MNIEHVGLETHAECVIWDPLPTTDKLRFDGAARTDIVKTCVERYKLLPIEDALESITIFDIAVVRVGGVKFKSEPLNTRTWAIINDAPVRATTIVP